MTTPSRSRRARPRSASAARCSASGPTRDRATRPTAGDGRPGAGRPSSPRRSSARPADSASVAGRLRPDGGAPSVASGDAAVPLSAQRRPLNPTEVRFAVRLTPRAAADRVDGVVDGVLRVQVAAPPIEGAANQALIRVLADELGIGRRSVRLVAGAAGRTKLVVVDGIDPTEIERRWPELALQ